LTNSIREVAESSTVIITMVTRKEQVGEILLGPESILERTAPDTVVLEMTYSDPAVTREMKFQ
jgi:3-hydroxyisobutyrate dehydrogenase-like beta-hydroxyacid dehydrogenase